MKKIRKLLYGYVYPQKDSLSFAWTRPGLEEFWTKVVRVNDWTVRPFHGSWVPYKRQYRFKAMLLGRYRDYDNYVKSFEIGEFK